MTELVDHTFVVLAYGKSNYLEECLISILQQSVLSSVVISTSTNSKWLRKLAQNYKIKLYVHEHRSIAHDWSYGYSIAQTRYVTLAHQDDIYKQNYTENLLYEASKYESSLITFCKQIEVKNNKEYYWTLNNLVKNVILRIIFFGKKNNSSLKRKKLLLQFGNPISCPSVMYNKFNLGIWNFSDSYKVNMDWDSWLRMARLDGGLVFVPEFLIGHRIHEDSETNKAIREGVRDFEDNKIFNLLWPWPVNIFFATFYKIARFGN